MVSPAVSNGFECFMMSTLSKEESQHDKSRRKIPHKG
jgi:hypothetical protein